MYQPPLQQVGALGHQAQYEFAPEEDQLIGDLASKMRFVGLMQIVFAPVILLGGIAHIATSRGHGGWESLVTAPLSLLVGIWIRSAAGGFQRIVDTRGSDIGNLMQALGGLRRIFTLQRTLYFVVIALYVVLILLVLAAVATKIVTRT